MTNAELIAKIKAEIERRWKDYRNSVTPDQPKYRTHYFVGKGEVCEELLSFLDTLESEKPMEQDGLEEELERFIASGKSVTVDDYGTYKVSYHDFKKVARHFAEWQKEQMMKEAVEGQVFGATDVKALYEGKVYVISNLVQDTDYNLYPNDKVRIIIVKE